MKKKRPVPQDVADHVGVTEMMVSRFLRNPEQVSVTLRNKIIAVPDGLGYIPNRAPDILSSATSRVIGVLLSFLIDQASAEVLRGIEVVTDTRGYQTMLAHYNYKPKMEQERLRSMLSWNIDGLILTERGHTSRTLRMIGVTGILVVKLTGSQPSYLGVAVDLGSFEATCQIAVAIIARGHRHVAYPDAHPDEHTIIKQRDCEQAMRDANLVPYSVIVEQSSSYSSGIGLIHRARREHPQLDGAFCTNDNLTVGTAFKCQRLGLRTSGNMAIAGFHDRDIGQVMEPRLASMPTPHERMGSIGTERLLTRVHGEAATPRMLDLGFILSPGGFV